MHSAKEWDATVFDVIVVGGGLAGMTAAALAARQGRSVALLEKSSHFGGRAATTVRAGVHFNLGPHALYCHGTAFRILTELGVPFSGQFPHAAGAFLMKGSRLFRRPFGLKSLLFSRLLSVREKIALPRFLKRLSVVDTRALDSLPLADWIREEVGTGNLGMMLQKLFCVTTYVEDQARLSAGAAIDQFRIGLSGNVWYLDDGWQTLIEGLRRVAMESGTQFRGGHRAAAVRCEDTGVTVTTADGNTLAGRTAILAVEPQAACEMLELPEDAALARSVSRLIPVKQSCFDVALTQLPRPERSVVFPIDRPLYYSVHSASAKLGPEGAAVIHVSKYLRDEPQPPAEALEHELESFLDEVQPGWRERVIQSRFLPKLTVTHALPRFDDRGLAGRPPVAVAERPGVFIAGDWVGQHGQLADAAAASAQECVARIDTSLNAGEMSQNPRWLSVAG